MYFISISPVMQKRDTQVKCHPVHFMWTRIRGPFRVIQCTQHQWEQYDVNMAGCLLCGAAHECSTSMCNNDCPLVTLEDGGVCCTITGYCAPVIRYSDNEYIENVIYTRDECQPKLHAQITFDECLYYIKWFLMGQTSVKCKTEEIDKNLSKIQSGLVKVLKQHKMDISSKQTMYSPCIITMLSRVVFAQRPKLVRMPTEELCRFCATHICQCINSLTLNNVQNRKMSLVVGMLYLMKQGLVIQNVQWLPKVDLLNHCLPHETNLEKVFKLSMKLVCETENEIKLALRHQVNLL